MRAVRQSPFPADRPRCAAAGASEVSRFSCRKCLGVSGVYDYAGLPRDSRWRPCACCLPPVRRRRRPDWTFSKLNTQPTYSPVYASLRASRRPAQNSGPSGSLLLPRENLPFSASCRFIPALSGPPLLRSAALPCERPQISTWGAALGFGSVSLMKNRRPQPRRSALRLLPVAANARGDRGTVRAGLWVLEEDADLFCDLGTQSVLDSAGMLVHHVVVDSEGVMKQPLRQPVATDDFLCARLAAAGQKEFAGFETDEPLPAPSEGRWRG